MVVELNHTIVWCRDKRTSAAYLASILGLAEPSDYGPFKVVELANRVSVDFHDTGEDIAPQHLLPGPRRPSA
jgi:hypothetical protein